MVIEVVVVWSDSTHSLAIYNLCQGGCENERWVCLPSSQGAINARDFINMSTRLRQKLERCIPPPIFYL